MEGLTTSPPENLQTAIQGLLATFETTVAKERLNSIRHLVFKPKPTTATNVYYPQYSLTSPNLSYLPLPPNLSVPVYLRLVPNPASIRLLTVKAMAFELATPTALLQSIHYYFSQHITTNLAKGLYPSFSEASLQITLSASKDPNAKEPISNIPVSNIFSTTGTGANMYVELLVKDATCGRLRAVVVYIDWKSRAQEAAECIDEQYEVAPRPRRQRMARRLAGRPNTFPSFLDGTDQGPNYAPDSPAFGSPLSSGGPIVGGRAAEEVLESLEEIAMFREGLGVPTLISGRSEFRQLLEATAPPGLREAMGGAFTAFLDALETVPIPPMQIPGVEGPSAGW